MAFNHKLYFGIIDAALKGLSVDTYNAWTEFVDNIDDLSSELLTNGRIKHTNDVWVLLKEAVEDAGLEDNDNPLLEEVEMILLTMCLEDFVKFFFHTEVANRVASGMDVDLAREQTHEWFDEGDNRWFDTPDGTQVYLNRDETITKKPKGRYNKKTKKKSKRPSKKTG